MHTVTVWNISLVWHITCTNRERISVLNYLWQEKLHQPLIEREKSVTRWGTLLCECCLKLLFCSWLVNWHTKWLSCFPLQDTLTVLVRQVRDVRDFLLALWDFENDYYSDGCSRRTNDENIRYLCQIIRAQYNRTINSMNRFVMKLTKTVSATNDRDLILDLVRNDVHQNVEQKFPFCECKTTHM